MYAVVDNDVVEPAGLTGLESAPVEVLTIGGLGFAISRHAHSTLPPSTDAAVLHAEVCDAFLGVATAVLPVRFGARYGDETSLRDGVSQQSAALRTALDHVRGRVEIGVRVATREEALPDADPLPASGARTGTEYLLQRRDDERRRAARRESAQQVADRVHASVSGHAIAAELKVLATPGLLLSAAYLVDRADVDDFTAAVAAISATVPDLQVVCTGPWPPYHFTGEGVLG